MTTQEILTANFWSAYRNSITYYSNSAHLTMTAANGKFYVAGNRFVEKDILPVSRTFENKIEAEDFVANLIK